MSEHKTAANPVSKPQPPQPPEILSDPDRPKDPIPATPHDLPKAAERPDQPAGPDEITPNPINRPEHPDETAPRESTDEYIVDLLPMPWAITEQVPE